MMWFLIFTLLGVATVLGVAVLLGVTNTRLKTRCTVVKHAREGLELQIQRRHEIVAAILDPIQRDDSYDLDSTDNVSFLAERARNTTKLSERSHFETALAESLKDLLTAVDNSPELSVNESYARPRQRLSEVEDDLRNAQRFYNDSVQQYNALLDSIPNRLIAAMFSFGPRDLVDIASSIPDAVTTVPETMVDVVPAPKGRSIISAKKV
jgi:LemA protein